MRNAIVNELLRLGEDNRTFLLLNDTGEYVFREFRLRFPHQLINVGIAESNLVGIAAGLAAAGYVPFTYSIAAFYARAYEQIRVDCCYNRANVKLIGIGAGISYGTMGPTHHTIDDIAAFRALPNMAIFSPADPVEAALLIKSAFVWEGPVYLRLGLAGEPIINATNYKPVIGIPTILREGTDIAIIATGRIVSEAIKTADMLASNGISCSVTNIHTLKPFDPRRLSKEFRCNNILTLEEHNIQGGLGSLVAEGLAEGGYRSRLIRCGLLDTFCPTYGSREYLYKYLRLDAISIAERIDRL